MDMDFFSSFTSSNPQEEFVSSKSEILKVLKRIGVDTRFVSYFEDDGLIKLYIENLRFSKFSKRRVSVFNRHYPDIEVVRSGLFQKICARASKTLAESLHPREKVLLPPMEDDYARLLYIVVEPYSRKYGIEFVGNNDLGAVDSIISPLNLNQEVNHILNDIFAGYGIEWDRKYEDALRDYGFIGNEESSEQGFSCDGESSEPGFSCDGESFEQGFSCDGESSELGFSCDGESSELGLSCDGESSELGLTSKEASSQHEYSANVVFPFINVPEEWINDFLGIEKEYAVDYDSDDIGESFMGFLGEINSQFKENVLATSSFLEEKHK